MPRAASAPPVHPAQPGPHQHPVRPRRPATPQAENGIPALDPVWPSKRCGKAPAPESGRRAEARATEHVRQGRSTWSAYIIPGGHQVSSHPAPAPAHPRGIDVTGGSPVTRTAAVTFPAPGPKPKPWPLNPAARKNPGSEFMAEITGTRFGRPVQSNCPRSAPCEAPPVPDRPRSLGARRVHRRRHQPAARRPGAARTWLVHRTAAEAASDASVPFQKGSSGDADLQCLSPLAEQRPELAAIALPLQRYVQPAASSPPRCSRHPTDA